MCDFKVGDEVVCVDDSRMYGELIKGSVYVVRKVIPGYIYVHGYRSPTGSGLDGFWPDRFRKVQRRDMTEWLSCSVGNTDKIDKRKRVNA